MPTYRVIGKDHLRVQTYRIELGTHADGSPHYVTESGPMERLPVGTLVNDLSDHELVHFHDRFELVDEGDLVTPRRTRASTSTSETAQEPDAMLMVPGSGVHEPASDLDAAVQKPLPSAEAMYAHKVAALHEKQALAEADAAHAEAVAKAAEARTAAASRPATTSARAPAAAAPDDKSPAARKT